MKNTLSPGHWKIAHWDLPGISTVKFLLEHSVGGIASLGSTIKVKYLLDNYCSAKYPLIQISQQPF
jgi:hypothetical protein